MAKSFIEHDRQLRAIEAGYNTHVSVMRPRTATPKNDVLVGWPTEWEVELEGGLLPTSLAAAAAASRPPTATTATTVVATSAAAAATTTAADLKASALGDTGQHAVRPSQRTPRLSSIASALAPYLFGDDLAATTTAAPTAQRFGFGKKTSTSTTWQRVAEPVAAAEIAKALFSWAPEGNVKGA